MVTSGPTKLLSIFWSTVRWGMFVVALPISLPVYLGILWWRWREAEAFEEEARELVVERPEAVVEQPEAVVEQPKPNTWRIDDEEYTKYDLDHDANLRCALVQRLTERMAIADVAKQLNCKWQTIIKWMRQDVGWLGKPIPDLDDKHLYNICRAAKRGTWKTGRPVTTRKLILDAVKTEFEARGYEPGAEHPGFEEQNKQFESSTGKCIVKGCWMHADKHPGFRVIHKTEYWVCKQHRKEMTINPNSRIYATTPRR